MAWQNPDPDEIRQRLQDVETIVMLGLSDDPGRDSNAVAHYLADQGYRVVPVNPTIEAWADNQVHPDLASAVEAVQADGGQVDLVDVFRAPKHVPAIVDEVVRLKLPALWLQLGVVDEAAAQHAKDAGVWVVMDRCIKVDHARSSV